MVLSLHSEGCQTKNIKEVRWNSTVLKALLPFWILGQWKNEIHFLIIKGTWHVTDKLWFLKKLPSYTVRTQPFPTHCSILLCAVGPALTALIQNPRAFWLLQREAKDRLSETLKPQNIHYWRDGQTPHGKSGSIKYTGKWEQRMKNWTMEKIPPSPKQQKK